MSLRFFGAGSESILGLKLVSLKYMRNVVSQRQDACQGNATRAHTRRGKACFL